MWFGTSSCFKPFLHMTHFGDGALQLSLHCTLVSVLDPSYQSQLFTLSLREKRKKKKKVRERNPVRLNKTKRDYNLLPESWLRIKPLKRIWYCPEQSKQDGKKNLIAEFNIKCWPLHFISFFYLVKLRHQNFSLCSTNDWRPNQMLSKWFPQAKGC